MQESITVDEARRMKRDAEIRIAGILGELQAKTGMTVTDISVKTVFRRVGFVKPKKEEVFDVSLNMVL